MDRAVWMQGRVGIVVPLADPCARTLDSSANQVRYVRSGRRRSSHRTRIRVARAVVLGRVVRFDVVKGYGFVAPDSGDEDVFLHVNDLEVDKQLITPGIAVEFDIAKGDKGLKASNVRLASGEAARTSAPTRRPDPAPRPAEGEDALLDVLTVDEYLAETTEAFLAAAPSITGEQILAIRDRLVKIAQSHRWVDAD